MHYFADSRFQKSGYLVLLLEVPVCEILQDPFCPFPAVFLYFADVVHETLEVHELHLDKKENVIFKGKELEMFHNVHHFVLPPTLVK